MKKIKLTLKNIIQVLSKNIPEIMFLLGIFFIVFSTFLINKIAGMYVLGAILTILGILFARHERR
ncbi:DUF1056 domain-containing protein [Clostridium botulinum]|uniref:hypothetical protein n=1 Tax=Clostridium botulinum TaxID=1491 RepID=UPI0005F8B96A|nr:hypothetical protein [Clostridium botulinum]MBY6799534.1 DUF1056 domain-containing protein [Clostridium botulinum]NFF20882.1 DUF1056 domain-containing protein [Clostridium botulinum]NFM75508.1 DUF1056 domain-containing protein [Clostridium botulinum]NFP81060.1 DUF1056 domain-containing protein [Clostridium botulinum]NFP94032.1 DUF1056 domain-containing protein [Clostridium botulinum]